MTSASVDMLHGVDALGAEKPGRLAQLRTFHTLDALRGIAACTIVLYHAAFLYGIAKPAEGQLAVDLFFVMSGFIVAHRYGGDLRQGMRLAQFIKLRLIRLYPLFLLGTVLGLLPAVVAVVFGHDDPLHVGLIKSFPLAVVMLPSRFALPSMQELYPLNYVAWSLVLEILVNIIYAATHRLWTIRNLLWLLVAASLGLGVCAFVFGRLNGGFDWSQMPVGFVRVVYGFGIGVLLCGLYERRPFAIRVPWWILLSLTVFVFFLRPTGAWALWDFVAITIIMPAIVVAAVVNEPPAFLRPACALAGIYSYTVYSLHVPLVGLFLRGENRAHLDVNTQNSAEAFLFTALLMLLCISAHLFYDKPLRRYLSDRLGRRTIDVASLTRPSQLRVKS